MNGCRSEISHGRARRRPRSRAASRIRSVHVPSPAMQPDPARIQAAVRIRSRPFGGARAYPARHRRQAGVASDVRQDPCRIPPICQKLGRLGHASGGTVRPGPVSESRSRCGKAARLVVALTPASLCSTPDCGAARDAGSDPVPISGIGCRIGRPNPTLSRKTPAASIPRTQEVRAATGRFGDSACRSVDRLTYPSYHIRSFQEQLLDAKSHAVKVPEWCKTWRS